MAGHLPDLGLDMQKLFDAGLHPVLIAQVTRHAARAGLAAAMLSRMAVDSSLMSQGSSSARLICSLFCKSRVAKSIIWHVAHTSQLAQAELPNLFDKSACSLFRVAQLAVLVSEAPTVLLLSTVVLLSQLCGADFDIMLHQLYIESALYCIRYIASAFYQISFVLLEV